MDLLDFFWRNSITVSLRKRVGPVNIAGLGQVGGQGQVLLVRQLWLDKVDSIEKTLCEINWLERTNCNQIFFVFFVWESGPG